MVACAGASVVLRQCCCLCGGAGVCACLCLPKCVFLFDESARHSKSRQKLSCEHTTLQEALFETLHGWNANSRNSDSLGKLSKFNNWLESVTSNRRVNDVSSRNIGNTSDVKQMTRVT